MDLSKGVALDGYPSTKEQADHLEALAQRLGLRTIIIILDVPDDVLRLVTAKTEPASLAMLP